ncbi:MAG: isoleucine--tRNA ligase [Dehalococcoidia bacterium]|nr:isoleucine--tRNA ligase [Dehalococcoidia bacterium]
MFKPVTSKVSFPELEKRIFDFWKEKRIFERSVEERKGGPLFVLYEGPPTANASPGVHHALSRVFKDVIPRYKTMKGYCAPRKAGWDTHGLPVELEVERELGFSSKAEIEGYGVLKFNERCRESVFRYQREWEELSGRIGFWLDMEHPYITLDNSYIESCWWVIKQLWEKGLIYQGYRVTPHCPRCGTSLSSHEVALGYEEADDPSIWVKFKVVPSQISESEGQKRLYKLSRDKVTHLLAWTTTPWTLPGNTALAVAPEAEYVVVKKDDEYLILASACLKQVGLDDCEVVERLKGNDLATITGVNYEPLYNPHQFGIERRRLEFINEAGVLGAPRLELQKPKVKLTYKVIAADFVSMEEGTGIVHVAPAFGQDDFEVGMHPDYCLDFVQPVDLRGNIIGNYPFAGMLVKEADPLIIEDLKSRGLLYRSERIRHTYPFCWRCATPLLYYAKPSWYIKTTAKKEGLIAGNEEINWYPEHIKHGRFGDWLENNVDWAFSRERYWGTPLPIWRCDSCGREECIGSLDELKTKPGLSAEPMVLKALEEGEIDLHRPYIDEVTFNCSVCRGEMRRLSEVLDAWFDSGAMPVAQWHYPFENEELFAQFFPADYICEAVDQTRGWFYTLHALSTLLFDRPCFRNVICLGHILDARGEKMSKSKGNVVDPWKILDSHGADALRWYLLTSSPAGSVRSFSAELVGEALRRFLLTLWNVYSFFVTYANIDKFDPRSAVDVPYESGQSGAELDRWILSELNQLIDEVTRAMEGYDPTDAGRRIQGFVEDLSNWYVRRSRRRFWKSENDPDKSGAYATLYECLVTISKLLAPLTPFVAEEMYQNLVCSVYPDEPESVHLTEFPIADLEKVDEQLSQEIHLAMKVSSLGRAARSMKGIKVRQPLRRVLVKAGSKGEMEGLERVKPQVLDELNVKDMEFMGPDTKVLSFLADQGEFAVASDATGFTVAIDTEITPELAAEGMARELVHRLQTMRKKADFEIADYILTYYQGGEKIKQVMREFAPYIKQETLSRDLIEGFPPRHGGAYTESHRIDGEEVLLGVLRSFSN